MKKLMSLCVQKYGGSSLADPKRIQNVARWVAESRKKHRELVVVVSAMGDTTDRLQKLAQDVVVDPPQREMDMLLSAGERISMALLSMCLTERGVEAISFTGSQVGIITDRSHRRARIKKILGDRVRASLKEGKVVIVAGFQGVSEDKEITTLGRGGSDTTAVALSVALDADCCEIYTDVDGIYSGNPAELQSAKLYSDFDYRMMAEYSARGAGVLHPRAVKLAEKYEVPLWVKNSLEPKKPGTRIIKMEKKKMEEMKLMGVTSDPSKVLLEVTLARPGVLGAVWDEARQSHLSIQDPVCREKELLFFVEKDAEGQWRKILQKCVQDGFVEEYDFKQGICPLSLVGQCCAEDGSALYQACDALNQAHVPVHWAVASEQRVTIAIPDTHIKEGAEALHKAFVTASP